MAAVAVSFVIALARLGRGAEPAVPALALAIVFNVAAYLPTPYVQDLLSTREISGRPAVRRGAGWPILGGPVVRARLVPALAATWPAPWRSATTPPLRRCPRRTSPWPPGSPRGT